MSIETRDVSLREWVEFTLPPDHAARREFADMLETLKRQKIEPPIPERQRVHTKAALRAFEFWTRGMPGGDDGDRRIAEVSWSYADAFLAEWDKRYAEGASDDQ